MSIDISDKRILLTGGSGFLGSFVQEELVSKGADKENIVIPRSSEMDLRVWENCVESVKGIDIVIHLAASVGGIGFNMKYPGDILYDNAIMGIQLIEAARREKVTKFVAIGTVCSYPKFCPVPFKEEELWNGYPEETNAPYGEAKKLLLVQAEAYRQQHGFNTIYLLPVNLYGPRDHFNTEDSHVIPALILKFIDAKEKGLDKIDAWGTGSASREFLYVEDAARAIVMATQNYDKSDPVNLGSGKEVLIRDLVSMIKDMVGFEGEVVWDASKPDGQPKRMLDVSKAKDEFGFQAEVEFKEGLQRTISWYKENIINAQ